MIHLTCVMLKDPWIRLCTCSVIKGLVILAYRTCATVTIASSGTNQIKASIYSMTRSAAVL